MSGFPLKIQWRSTNSICRLNSWNSKEETLQSIARVFRWLDLIASESFAFNCHRHQHECFCAAFKF